MAKPEKKLTIHAVILAGGRGTRFWPRSRTRTPKQLLNIIGKETMLEQTVARLRPLIPAECINDNGLFLDDETFVSVREALPMPVYPSYDFADALSQETERLLSGAAA